MQLSLLMLLHLLLLLQRKSTNSPSLRGMQKSLRDFPQAFFIICRGISDA